MPRSDHAWNRIREKAKECPFKVGDKAVELFEAYDAGPARMLTWEGRITRISGTGISVFVQFEGQKGEREFRLDRFGHYTDGSKRLHTAAEAEAIITERTRRANRLGEFRWCRRKSDQDRTRWEPAEMTIEGWVFPGGRHPYPDSMIDEGPLCEGKPGPGYEPAREDELEALGVDTAGDGPEGDDDEDEDSPAP